ncbi:mRNA-degrading endonuclease [Clostridia bacterium]|nr:mRNA-degrading endonuclease [Clostridia bacterium]
MTFEQGTIIAFNFSPAEGHEQAGYRPALVVSKTILNKRTGQAIVCPITSKEKPYATRIALDETTKTQGFVICEHLKTIDTYARNVKVVECVSTEILDKVLEMVKMFF